jgi:hypothetical protein
MYGDYELGNEIASTRTSVIYLARRQGREYVIKVFRPLMLAEEAHQESGELQELGENVQRVFLDAVKVQKDAVERGQRYLAPIHDVGVTEEGAWYATDYYPRGSLKRWIGEALDSADLRLLIWKVVDGLLDMLRITGRSHGNLKPANILVGGQLGVGTSPGRSVIFLSDPLGQADAKALELVDLRCLGELILQLVTGREISGPENYNYPIEPTDSWNQLGEQKDYWLSLCNRMVNPKLTLQDLTLERLAGELKPTGSAFSPGDLVRKARELVLRLKPAIPKFSLGDQFRKFKAFAERLKPAGPRFSPGDLMLSFRKFTQKLKPPGPVPSWVWKMGAAVALVALVCCGLRFAPGGMFPGIGGKRLAASFHNRKAQSALDTMFVTARNSAKTNSHEKQFSNALADYRRALRVRSGDAECLEGVVAMEREIAGEKLKAAKNKAFDMETKSDWVGAYRQWQTVKTMNEGDPDAANGLRFFQVITNTLDLVRQARTNTTPEQTSNSCMSAMALLTSLTFAAAQTNRTAAVGNLTNEVAQLYQKASNLIAARKQREDAIRAATLAESHTNWGEAFNAWERAWKSGGSNDTMSNGMAFARAMTNAQKLLAEARGLSTNNLIGLKNLYLQLQAEWPSSALWSGDEVRKRAVETLAVEASPLAARFKLGFAQPNWPTVWLGRAPRTTDVQVVNAPVGSELSFRVEGPAPGVVSWAKKDELGLRWSVIINPEKLRQTAGTLPLKLIVSSHKPGESLVKETNEFVLLVEKPVPLQLPTSLVEALYLGERVAHSFSLPNAGTNAVNVSVYSSSAAFRVQPVPGGPSSANWVLTIDGAMLEKTGRHDFTLVAAPVSAEGLEPCTNRYSVIVSEIKSLAFSGLSNLCTLWLESKAANVDFSVRGLLPNQSIKVEMTNITPGFPAHAAEISPSDWTTNSNFRLILNAGAFTKPAKGSFALTTRFSQTNAGLKAAFQQIEVEVNDPLQVGLSGLRNCQFRVGELCLPLRFNLVGVPQGREGGLELKLSVSPMIPDSSLLVERPPGDPDRTHWQLRFTNTALFPTGQVAIALTTTASLPRPDLRMTTTNLVLTVLPKLQLGVEGRSSVNYHLGEEFNGLDFRVTGLDEAESKKYLPHLVMNAASLTTNILPTNAVLIKPDATNPVRFQVSFLTNGISFFTNGIKESTAQIRLTANLEPPAPEVEEVTKQFELVMRRVEPVSLVLNPKVLRGYVNMPLPPIEVRVEGGSRPPKVYDLSLKSSPFTYKFMPSRNERRYTLQLYPTNYATNLTLSLSETQSGSTTNFTIETVYLTNWVGVNPAQKVPIVFNWVTNLPGGGGWKDVPEAGQGGWVGVYEISQKEYAAVMRGNPSAHKVADGETGFFPVENVSWTNAMEFCAKINTQDTDLPPGWEYRLPSMKQQEHFIGDLWLDNIPAKNYHYEAYAVATPSFHPEQRGTKKRNKYGLYDVIGNVMEWPMAEKPAETIKVYSLSFKGPSLFIIKGTYDALVGGDPKVGFRVILAPK